MGKSKWKRGLALLIATVMLPAAAPPTLVSHAEEVGQSGDGNVTTYQMAGSERTINFDKDWKFRLADAPPNQVGEITGAERVDYDDSDWRSLDLPHDWSIELDFNIKNSVVGSEAGYLDGGTGYYRKTFTLPEIMDGKRINIRFGGVYMNSTVWVNGQLVGTYPNGYMPFTYDITNYVTADGATENVIAVKVVNRQPSSRWYSGSGIYRSVDLVVTDPVHVAEYGTFVTTPNIETEYPNGTVTVNAKTEVENETEAEANVTVRSTVLNYEDDTQVTEPMTTDATTVVGSKETVTINQDIPVANPTLWSTTNPKLYKLRTEILVDGQVVDTYDTRFGFRWFEFDANEGFFLNGNWMKLKGVCMHHDQGALGAVANYRAIERQMEIMQEMGVNAIRVTHNPAADELLEICDEKGLLVIEEAFDTWYGGKKTYDYHNYFEASSESHPDGAADVTWAEFDLKQMVKRGRNNPSVIAWSVGNEITEATGDNKSLQTIQNLKKWTEEIDSTRPITMGTDKFRFGNGTGNHENIAEYIGLVGFNYAEANYDTIHQRHPDWVLYGSETSSATKSRGIYAHPDSEGVSDANAHTDNYQQSSYDNDRVSWGSTATNAWIWDRDREYIPGEFVWTGFDYIGEPTPWHNTGGAGHDLSPKSSFFGIVDTAGFPKDDYYLYQSVWIPLNEDNSNAMVHILPHWNWEDEELREDVTDKNGKIPIRVYSNAPAIELLVDGESQGTKEFYQTETDYGLAYQQESEDSDRLYQEWRLDYDYEPGTTIEAVAKDADGNEIARDTVVTAGESAQIELTADRTVIEADGYDLSYITVDIQDEDGNFMPTADDEIRFSISGNGTIVGVDNGDPTSHERYKAQADGTWKRKAFNGKALVIVQSTEEGGSFELTASGSGLKSDSVKVFTNDSDSSEGNPILGYENITVTTDVNVLPTLPTEITAVHADGTEESLAVTWDDVTEEQVSQAGVVIVGGIVTDTQDAVTLRLEVNGPVGVKDISVVTGVGAIPELPKTVEVVYSDGTTRDTAVDWAEITADQVDAVTETPFKVTGTTEFGAASCFVRVSDDLQYNVNISANPDGSAYPKTDASYNKGSGNNMSGSVIDGKKGASDMRPCWNNWISANTGNAAESWVSVEFEETQQIGRVGMYWFTDSQTKLPATAVIEYSQNGSEWTAVTNQSISELADFSTGSMNEITFDPIEAKYIRVLMTGQTNSTGGPCPVGIEEFEVYGTDGMVTANSAAALEDLQVNGATIDGFASDKYNYEITYPYGTEMPELTASVNPADNSTVFILPAMERSGEAVVMVTAEDGTVQSYIVKYTEEAPKLKSSVISVANTTMTEDQTQVISITNTMEDNSVLDAGKADVQYTVTSTDGGVAEVVNGEILAYTAGTVNIQATATYEGTAVQSNILTITIKPGEVEKNITGYDPVQLTTKPGVAPELPNEVRAYYDNGGLPRMVSVTWDTIPEEKLNQFGEFTVEGTVEGASVRPKATITVVGMTAVEGVSVATPVNVAPVYPETVTVYYSDGTSAERRVTWETDGVSYAEGGMIEVTGVIEGEEEKAVANVRVVDDEDQLTDSANYAQQWTGSKLPAAMASNTNDGDASNDRIELINDTQISFNDSPANRWTNWSRNPENDVWVGIIFAQGGMPTQRDIDKIVVGFFGDSGTDAPKNMTIEYFTGTVTDQDIPTNLGHVTDGIFANDENWAPVEGLGEITDAEKGKMTEYSFDTVRTYAIRLNMTKKDAMSGIAITELEAYGKEVQLYDNFEVTSVKLGDTDITEALQENPEYEYVVEDGVLPEISVDASNNAKVTVVPAVSPNGTATITIEPENGDASKRVTYTIRFTKKEKPELPDIVSVEPIESRTVDYGTAFADLGLPSEVTVTLSDQTQVNVPVQWNSADYQAGVPGEQMIYGTLQIDGNEMTNNSGIRAQAVVTVREQTPVVPEIIGIENTNIGQVVYGTVFENLALPSEAAVQLNNGTTRMVPVVWDGSTYDPNTAGGQTIYGDLQLTEGEMTNPSELRAVAAVTVKEKTETVPKITGVTKIDLGTVVYGTAFKDLKLPGSATVTLDDGTTQNLRVVWDASTYDPDAAGRQTIYGALQFTEGTMINPSNLKAEASVVVNKEISGQEKPAGDQAVATGDQASVWMYAVFMAFALAGVCALMILKRKNK